MKLQTDISDQVYVEKIEVTLSRRNLLALLHKLDWKGSARTIQKYQDGLVLSIVAEDDYEHYGDGEAGVMHDETEQFIEWNTIDSYGDSK